MSDYIRRWLDRNSRAETGQIWSIILMPIWLPVLFVLYHGDNIRRWLSRKLTRGEQR